MRKVLVSAVAAILGLSFAVASANANIRVVSDIDDTTKITDVGDPLAMVVNGLFSNRAFAGMRELYLSFSIERKYFFDYVTGSPDLLRFRAEKFLESGGFPVGELHLKPTFGSEKLRAYKTRVIRELMEKNPKDVFILIGDDTQADYLVYDELYRYAPDRILAIYIRKVTNHKLPPSAYPFLSAFDLARTEHLMGRLTVAQAAPVALAILGEKKDVRVIPRFSYCPVQMNSNADPQIEKWSSAIDARIEKICRNRRSGLE
jgi:phosphatidate phosphatase APP1